MRDCDGVRNRKRRDSDGVKTGRGKRVMGLETGRGVTKGVRHRKKRWRKDSDGDYDNDDEELQWKAVTRKVM